MKDKATGAAKGYAFVEFTREVNCRSVSFHRLQRGLNYFVPLQESVDAALDLDEVVIHGRKVTVSRKHLRSNRREVRTIPMNSSSTPVFVRTHARTHTYPPARAPARTNARMPARMPARTHARSLTHTHTLALFTNMLTVCTNVV